jgi:putative DNA primase/helicase
MPGQYPTHAPFDSVRSVLHGNIEGYLREWLPGGDVSGHEYRALNPTRADSSKGSFTINIHTGAWLDGATGDTGLDLISLWAYIREIQGDRKKAQSISADELNDQYGMGFRINGSGNGAGGPPVIPRPRPAASAKEPKEKPTVKTVMPVPDGAPRPPQKYNQISVKNDETGEWLRYDVDHRYEYRDQEGRLLGYVDRADKKGDMKRKETRPLTYVEDKDGLRKWDRRGFDTPRPLYGLYLLAQYPDARVLIVEGEKCADAANKKLIPLGWVAVSFPNGTSAARNTDLTPLIGRDCVCWPDNDKQADKKTGNLLPWDKQPSAKNMLLIAETIGAGRIMKIPDEYPGGGWDFADAIIETGDGPFIADIPAFIESCCQATEKYYAKHDAEPTEETLADNRYFSAEGISSMEDSMFKCVYIRKSGNAIAPIRADLHNEGSMTALAPLSFYERMTGREGKAALSYAKQIMVEACCKLGNVNSTKRRSRGVWEDDGKLVLHLGDRLLSEGQTYELNGLKSGYSYRLREPVPFGNGKAATDEKATELLKLCGMLPWSSRESAMLLAGWMFLAPICGLLSYRPTVWIFGPAGSGKTFTANEIAGKVLHRFCLSAQGSSSEAGIRSSLFGDAYPVVIDEAEGNDDERRHNITRILNMIRQSSSASSFPILKGSASGSAVRYGMSAMFCLFSISPTAEQAADLSRISMLELSVRKDKQAFNALDAAARKLLTGAYSEALILRAVGMWPVIRQSIKVFSEVVAEQFGGDARMGDQYGTLLAGAWCLRHSRVPAAEEARKLVKLIDWRDAQTQNADTDSEQCLRRLMQHKVTVRVNTETTDYASGNTRASGAMYETSVGEMVAQLFNRRDTDGMAADSGVPDDEAMRYLRAMGLWVKEFPVPGDGLEKRLLVSNNHERLKDVFARSPWPVGWNRILSKLSPDTINDKSVTYRFTPWFKDTPSARALSIPAKDLFGLDAANDNAAGFRDAGDEEEIPF